MAKLSFLERIFEKNDSKFTGKSAIPQKIVLDSTELLSPFSIFPRAYEGELDKKYGIVLGEIMNGVKSGFQGDLKNNVSFNGGDDFVLEEIDEKILKKYESIPDFCSMRINDKEELMEHVKIIHELSYNHYVFGKESDMRGVFPRYCCGKSAANLFLILMEKGYPNSSFFYNDSHDHAYNGLPFLFGKNNEKGFIIVDPTSDQLFDNKNKSPRNNLFVVPGVRWDYKSDWSRGANLFPSSENHSRFSNLHTLRTNPGSDIYEKKGIYEYFDNVFKNVVEVNVNF